MKDVTAFMCSRGTAEGQKAKNIHKYFTILQGNLCGSRTHTHTNASLTKHITVSVCLYNDIATEESIRGRLFRREIEKHTLHGSMFVLDWHRPHELHTGPKETLIRSKADGEALPATIRIILVINNHHHVA